MSRLHFLAFVGLALAMLGHSAAACTYDSTRRSQSSDFGWGWSASATDASGRRTEYRHDANGNRTQVRTPDGRETLTTYDALNRATRIDWPDGSSRSVVFRTDGRKASETDPRGVTTSYGYDATGRLTSVTQSGVAQATTYAYDQTGAKTTQTDANNHPVAWRFDVVGRSTSRTLPDGQTEAFEYDLNGQMTAHTTFGGQRLQFSYDSAGRQTSRIIAATANTPARAAQFSYNPDGQRQSHAETGATSANGNTTYGYDAQGRLIALATPQGNLAWTYDAAGRIAERSTSEGTTGYQYDGDGRLTTLTAPDGKQTTYTYDAAGRNTRSAQQLDGTTQLVTEQRRYDSADRQVTIAHSKQGTSTTTLIAGQTIARGQGGAVSRIDSFDATASFDATTGTFSGNPARVQIFAYDANARLSAEREYKGTQLMAFLADSAAQATVATTYAYDAVGNRTGKTVTTPAGTESTSYSYDANDRLAGETLTTTTGSTVTTSYTWDANGNLASQQTPSEHTAYVFDADNRLVEVKRGATPATATTVAHYGYDADGQRIRKETPTGTTHYLIDPTTTWPQVVLETQGNQRTAYTWGDQLRRQARGAAGAANAAPTEALIPLPGHLGTTIAAIDASGNVVERYEAGAFGEPTNPNPKTHHQYTGEYWDAEAKLTYLRARWYAPGSARFLSVDPAMGRMADARSLNRYSYAHSDPVHGRDPRGKFSMGELSIGNAISVAMAGYTGYSATTNVMKGDYTGAATDVALGLITLGAASTGPAIFKAITGSCSAWCTLFFRFPVAERAVIAEVKAMQGTGLYAKARAAMATGEQVEVVIGRRAIIIAPQMPASGMTFFADDVFVIGREALVSEAEFFKTLLHELYRLAFQRGVQAGAVGAATEPTAAAAAFAERAISLFVR